MSHHRGVLGEDAIVRHDHADELELDLVDVDAIDFERLVRRASTEDDASKRWRLARAALQLWRSTAFGDLAAEPVFALESYRLDELRLMAMELSLGAELDLGRHDLVVGELESAVREQPDRERLWQLLVRALLAGDRRVEALRACADVRQVLVEVEITSGDDWTELEDEIRSGLSGDLTH